MAALAPYPTFLILGFQRNATRWLRFNLDAHPDICAPPIYPDFFTDADRMARLGLRWYKEQFADWDGEPVIGEASWSYLDGSSSPNEVCDRIGKLLPDVRLIALLDDPVTRFKSAFRHLIRWGHLPPDIDAEAFYRFEVEPAIGIQTIYEGMQSPSLRPYINRFGDQLELVFLDDVRADPQAAYRSVLRHIGADDAFVPDGLEIVRYSDRPVVEVPEPSEEARQLIFAWYRPDKEIIEDWTGRDLSSWDPGVGPNTPSAQEMAGVIWASRAAQELAS